MAPADRGGLIINDSFWFYLYPSYMLVHACWLSFSLWHLLGIFSTVRIDHLNRVERYEARDDALLVSSCASSRLQHNCNMVRLRPCEEGKEEEVDFKPDISVACL